MDDNKNVTDDGKIKRKDGKWSTLRGEAKWVEKSTYNHHEDLGSIKRRAGWSETRGEGFWGR